MRLFFIILLAVTGAIALFIILRKPRADRNWMAPLAHAPQFIQRGDSVWALDHLRGYEFGADGASVKKWRPAQFDCADLTEIWFFVEPFTQWNAAAHSFLSFVFAGQTSQTVSVSVEARRKEGDAYSGLRGMLNAYELIYLWSTEKDILTRIAINLDHNLYAYKLDITPEQARAVLDYFIARTNRLKDHPRFYNTVASNCTNELAKAVNDAFPGALPWHYSHILTGYSAERLHALQFIRAEGPFEDFKARADIRSTVQGEQDTHIDEFSNAWRRNHDGFGKNA